MIIVLWGNRSAGWFVGHCNTLAIKILNTRRCPVFSRHLDGKQRVPPRAEGIEFNCDLRQVGPISPKYENNVVAESQVETPWGHGCGRGGLQRTGGKREGGRNAHHPDSQGGGWRRGADSCCCVTLRSGPGKPAKTKPCQTQWFAAVYHPPHPRTISIIGSQKSGMGTKPHPPPKKMYPRYTVRSRYCSHIHYNFPEGTLFGRQFSYSFVYCTFFLEKGGIFLFRGQNCPPPQGGYFMWEGVLYLGGTLLGWSFDGANYSPFFFHFQMGFQKTFRQNKIVTVNSSHRPMRTIRGEIIPVCRKLRTPVIQFKTLLTWYLHIKKPFQNLKKKQLSERTERKTSRSTETSKVHWGWNQGISGVLPQKNLLSFS